MPRATAADIACHHGWAFMWPHGGPALDLIADRDERWHAAEQKRRILDRASKDWRERHPDAPA